MKLRKMAKEIVSLSPILFINIFDPAQMVTLMITYWPLWILPMITAGLFGIVGLFIGLFMGIFIGTEAGIIPINITMLMLLGALLILSRREL